MSQGSGTLLWLSNSSTEIRVCADSCAAFIQLLDHFMHDRDLGIPEDIDAEELEEMVSGTQCSLVHAGLLHVFYVLLRHCR